MRMPFIVARKLLLTATFTSVCFSATKLAFSEQNEEEVKKPSLDISLIESDDDPEHWQKKADGCSFCRDFLASPCPKPFKQWSKCVDQAKSLDLVFTEVCREYTNKLFSCMNENREYFENLKRQNEAERHDDDDDDDDVDENENSDEEGEKSE